MTNCTHTNTMTETLKSFDASGILGAPFAVLVQNAIKQETCSDCGEVLSHTILDPENLLAVTAILRALNSKKLDGDELRFLRKSLCKKSKDMAARLDIAPETYSRYENGSQSIGEVYEKLVRADVCLHHLEFVKTIDVDIRSILNMNIVSARDVSDPLSLSLVRDELGSTDTEQTKWKIVA